MSITTPHFKRPIKGLSDPKVAESCWDKAVDAYDNKDFKQSVIEVINYINTSALKGVDTTKDFEIIKEQGSAEIHISLTSTELFVKAPFLKVTDSTNKIALFRKVSELNFSPLTLAQVYLKGDALWFEHKCPLELANPYKVYEVFREISVNADDYDDEFVEKFKADFYSENTGKELTEEEQTTVWNQIDQIREDYKIYSQAFKEKRKDNFQWDIVLISVLKLSNMPYVNGMLRTKLQEYVNNMMNGNIDFNFRVDKGTSFMKKLCNMSKEEIMKDVYHADSFISLRWRSSTEIMQNEAKDMEEIVRNYQKNNDNFALSYYLQVSFLHLVYKFNLETERLDMIYNVLEDVSGLEPHEGAPKLAKVYDCLLNGQIIKGNRSSSSNKKEKKGFFAKLFS